MRSTGVSFGDSAGDIRAGNLNLASSAHSDDSQTALAHRLFTPAAFQFSAPEGIEQRKTAQELLLVVGMHSVDCLPLRHAPILTGAFPDEQKFGPFFTAKSRTMPFSPPKQSAFKQFVILDSDGVVSALSAIDGGQIDEILTRSAEESDGGFGGEVGAGPVKAKGKRSKGRKVEEEIRKARTRHATAAKLLEALHSRESIGVVDGPLDLEVAEQIEAGMVLEFRADLHLHPLHRADQMLRSFLEVGPKLGQQEATRELKKVLDPWGVISGTGRSDAPWLIQPFTNEDQTPRLLMPVPKKDFELPLDDVLGEVTVIAQVERILEDGESNPVVRILRGGPATSLERGAVEETLPGLADGLGNLGLDISREDIFIHGPALLLRAICCYR